MNLGQGVQYFKINSDAQNAFDLAKSLEGKIATFGISYTTEERQHSISMSADSKFLASDVKALFQNEGVIVSEQELAEVKDNLLKLDARVADFVNYVIDNEENFGFEEGLVTQLVMDGKDIAHLCSKLTYLADRVSDAVDYDTAVMTVRRGYIREDA